MVAPFFCKSYFIPARLGCFRPNLAVKDFNGLAVIVFVVPHLRPANYPIFIEELIQCRLIFHHLMISGDFCFGRVRHGDDFIHFYLVFLMPGFLMSRSHSGLTERKRLRCVYIVAQPLKISNGIFKIFFEWQTKFHECCQLARFGQLSNYSCKISKRVKIRGFLHPLLMRRLF